MTTTDLQQQQQGHLTESHHNTQQLHASPQAHTPIYHYPQHQKHTTLHHTHPLINPFKMDADFWQQARGAPFGLHAALATNHMHHSQTVTTHLPHQQQQPQHHQPQHHLIEQPHAAPPQHMSQNASGNQQENSTLMAEQQHHHQQHHTHEQQQQHSHLTHLGSEQSHHLLFNAAAAAAAAAHLSGVVKSNELSATTTNADDKIINNNNNTRNNNNSNTDPNIITKQEPHAANASSNGGGGAVYGASIANNIALAQQQQQHGTSDQQQQQNQIQHLSHQYNKEQHSLKFERNISSPGTLPLDSLQQQMQQEMQQQKQPNEHLRLINNNNSNTMNKHEMHQENPPQHHQQLQALHPQHLTAANASENSTPNRQQLLPVTTATDSPLAPTSPLQLSALGHHQTPTSSPQPSLTSPSGGSSTPDLKFNSENNNKLPNELQLQLSRSNSAAAISERTLEECWSTLQRLFMHKSAMQQIQQQIPRTGLGPAGAGGIGAESKPHQCQQCMKSFSSNHQLVQHIRVHTGEKPYKCSYCDRRFKQLSHVQQHTRLHTGERPYKCHLPECGRAFIQLSNLQQHLRNHDAQVERAKNRPFHCNICGKGFATESSLRTHTSKELQLHLGVLQQHAALIGGPNATSCPICHKLFLGTDALMEHMKHVHKEKSSSQSNNNPFIDSICGSAGNNLSNAGSTSCLQSSGASSSNDPYSAKRRTANHPCPVCGKHYVNEGSLRKHLACHAETSQLTNSLRMWPCSVCQAVFTHENGLLTHMEHMRMDPKHQFAAQYVLSRAAAERRDRDNILAATLAVSAGSGGTGLMPILGEGGGGGSNSLCPSPSANSECSSTGRLSSSAASDPGSGINLLNNNNNNNNSTNNNNNCNNSNSNLSLSNKLNDILRTSNNTNPTLGGPLTHPHHNHPHNLPGHSYGGVAGVDADLQNRMSLMAAASAAAAAVAASANSSGVASLSSPQRFGVDSTHTSAGNAAVQAAVVNLAAAMRLNQTSGGSSTTPGTNNANSATMQQQQQQQQHLSQNQPQSTGSQSHTNGRPLTPTHQVLATDSSTAVMNAMRDTMMRSSMMESTSQETNHHQQQQQQSHQQQQQQHPPGSSAYSHTNNSNMNQQNVSQSHHLPNQQQQQQQQQQQRHQPQTPQHLQHLHQQHPSTASGALQHLHQHNHTPNNPLQAPPPHSPEAALHMQQQAEAILRSHTEAAFRLAASVVQQQTPELSSNNNNNNEKYEQHQPQPIKHPANEDPGQQQQQKLNPNSQDISEAIRLQEHRLEQALRLHNDVRTFNFLNTSTTQQQQQQQQPNNATNHTTTNTTNTEAAQQQHHHTT